MEACKTKTNKSLYPEIYITDNHNYTYYTDFEEKIYLIAGSDGVTEEHIAALKELHRREVVADRRYKRYRRIGKKYESAMCSLDELQEDMAAESRYLLDEASNCETIFLEAEARRELSDALIKALAEMGNTERDLFTRLWIAKEPVSTIAEQEGVTVRTIRYRAARIVKSLEKRCKIISFLASELPSL